MIQIRIQIRIHIRIHIIIKIIIKSLNLLFFNFFIRIYILLFNILYAMIILLRGHIRNSFDNDNLYNLIKDLSISNNISIYIHTWHIIQNSLSWRHIDENNNIVTNDLIYSYFKDISHLIKLIIIDDDSKINLIGNLDGTIMNTKCPIKGWKNLWYSNYKIITYIKSMNKNHNETVVNMRFDIYNNSNNLTYDQIINFIDINKNNNFDKNCFRSSNSLYGIDNIFIGNIHTMYYLLNNLYRNLDSILEKFKFLNIIAQEEYVYYENCFGKDFNCFVYKVMNNFNKWSDTDVLRHWINHGRNENRICYLPDDFNYDVYRIESNFMNWTEEEIITHWFNHGQYQGWQYKLPDGFNFDFYRIENNVTYMTNSDIVWHWCKHGQYQGWQYKLPDGFNFDFYRMANNVIYMTDSDIVLHWCYHGKHQGWNYKSN